MVWNKRCHRVLWRLMSPQWVQASADPLYSGFVSVLDLAAQVELQTETTAWLPLSRCGEQQNLNSTKDKNGSSRIYEVAPPVETWKLLHVNPPPSTQTTHIKESSAPAWEDGDVYRSRLGVSSPPACLWFGARRCLRRAGSHRCVLRDVASSQAWRRAGRRSDGLLTSRG